MKLKYFANVLIVVLRLMAASVSADQAAPEAQFFHRHVEPILVGHCLECHGMDRKGDFDLRTEVAALAGGESGACIEPGKPDDSLLIDYVANEKMPPESPLSADQVAVLQQWIADGAFYPAEPLDLFSITTDHRAGYDWWSLQPLADSDPPTPEGLPAAWSKNPIDQFVFAKLVEKGLEPSVPASPPTLIRRATYDLTGLPPSPEEVETFREACQTETGTADLVGDQAYQKLLDRLLASPRYGEQWARHWLDVVRFGESVGFETNVIIDNAWPFRDYIIRSLNEDKPFDQLIREHLAGDVIGKGDPDVEVGAAFLVCGPYDSVGNQDVVQAAQTRANTVDDIIRATSEAFLGLTIGCARCHDHKFDPVAQQDYYRLHATFAGVFHGSRMIGTDAQKRELEAAEQPLKTTLQELGVQKDDLENLIFGRAEKKLAHFETAWTRPAVDRTGTEEKFAPVEVRYVRLIGEAVDTSPESATGYTLDEFEVWTTGESSRNVALAASGGKAAGASNRPKDFAEAYGSMLTIDGKYGARWQAAAPDLTITLAQPAVVDRVVFSSDRPAAAGNDPVAPIVCEYRIEVSLDQKQWTEVANSKNRKPKNDAHRRIRLIRLEATAKQRQHIADLKAEIGRVQGQLSAIAQLPSWWVGTPRQPAEPSHVLLGGDPERPGIAVVPASLHVLSRVAGQYELAAEAPEGQRRQALAEWIVARDNPLTPRVLANRLWHYHFGTGIVATPSDLGFMGGRPTDPDLLDWLATNIHAEQWRLKPLHKRIMLSQAYRQASAYRAAAARTDSRARYLWRYPPRRLAAEEIRDTMLQVAGKLNTEMGGPGFRLYEYTRDNVATYYPLAEFGPPTFRRSVYHQNVRASQIDLLSEFDSPDCAFSTPRRSATTTPLQALTLMNHSFTIDMARAFAERIEQDVQYDPASGDRTAVIQRAFVLLFSRPCSEEERIAARRTIEEHGMRAFCRALLNANELIYIN